MRSKTWRRFLVTLIILITADSALRGQETLEISLARSNMETITDSATLEVRISNLTDHDVDVSRISLKLPASFRQRSTSCDPEAIDFIAKESKTINCKIDSLSLAANPSLLFFRHKPYDIEIELPYRIERQIDAEIGTLPLSPLAPWPGAFLGGIVGVFLLLALREALQRWRPALISDVAPFWISALVGILVVLIASLLFRYADVKHPDLPFAIQVRDFVGGIFVGLLFEPIALWLAKIVGGSQG